MTVYISIYFFPTLLRGALFDRTFFEQKQVCFRNLNQQYKEVQMKREISDNRGNNIWNNRA